MIDGSVVWIFQLVWFDGRVAKLKSAKFLEMKNDPKRSVSPHENPAEGKGYVQIFFVPT